MMRLREPSGSVRAKLEETPLWLVCGRSRKPRVPAGAPEAMLMAPLRVNDSAPAAAISGRVPEALRKISRPSEVPRSTVPGFQLRASSSREIAWTHSLSAMSSAMERSSSTANRVVATGSYPWRETWR